jgi:hypothetical protein
MAGYFSKVTQKPLGYAHYNKLFLNIGDISMSHNVFCIMSLWIRQQNGYGQYLIDFGKKQNFYA